MTSDKDNMEEKIKGMLGSFTKEQTAKLLEEIAALAQQSKEPQKEKEPEFELVKQDQRKQQLQWRSEQKDLHKSLFEYLKRNHPDIHDWWDGWDFEVEFSLEGVGVVQLVECISIKLKNFDGESKEIAATLSAL